MQDGTLLEVRNLKTYFYLDEGTVARRVRVGDH